MSSSRGNLGFHQTIMPLLENKYVRQDFPVDRKIKLDISKGILNSVVSHVVTKSRGSMGEKQIYGKSWGQIKWPRGICAAVKPWRAVNKQAGCCCRINPGLEHCFTSNCHVD